MGGRYIQAERGVHGGVSEQGAYGQIPDQNVPPEQCARARRPGQRVCHPIVSSLTRRRGIVRSNPSLPDRASVLSYSVLGLGGSAPLAPEAAAKLFLHGALAQPTPTSPLYHPAKSHQPPHCLTSPLPRRLQSTPMAPSAWTFCRTSGARFTTSLLSSPRSSRCSATQTQTRRRTRRRPGCTRRIGASTSARSRRLWSSRGRRTAMGSDWACAALARFGRGEESSGSD